jgi:hypothetical protein
MSMKTLNDRDANATCKYIAVLPHVREIALLGTADLDYWKDRLAEEDLYPLDFGGHAHVLVSAIESRFLGVRFREISITFFARRNDGDGGQDGLFLALAFNSSRFFAAVERTAFSTPYIHGRIRIDTGLPGSITLSDGSDATFGAAMAHEGDESFRDPVRVGDDGWDGPIFLPRVGRGPRASGKWFCAKVAGHTRVYPFLPADDQVKVGLGRNHDALRRVIDSGFAGQEWSIREDSRHSRTKTFRKGQGPD